MNASRMINIGILLLALLGSYSNAASAQSRDDHRDRGDQRRDRDDDRRGDRGDDRRDRNYVLDHRYDHDRYYPRRGYEYQRLPSGYYPIRYRGSPYYFYRGSWFRPYGSRFVVIAPPIGIGVPLLPPFYTTVWLGGLPYYYADSTYYMWRPERREYVVTEPPRDAASGTTTPPASDEMFVYPKNGQSEQQQGTDRYECHSWAAQQTGFDPTQPLGGVQESEVENKRTDYRRAEGACLEARGYSVK